MTATIPAEAPPEPVVVTEPGVYLDLPAEQYFADPVPGGSLSCSGAKRLLPPSCPALFDWERRNPPPPKLEFDVGHAAHSLALGAGPKVVVVEADDWRTAKAKAKRAEAYLAGEVPLLRKDYEPIVAMAEALMRQPLARKLIEGAEPEASLFCRDPETGVWLRSRFDLLRRPQSSGRLIVGDYKTAASANPRKFAKSAADFGYHQQADFYQGIARTLELAEDTAFLFIVQEKTAPYLVSVVQLDPLDERIGGYLNRKAIRIYARCVESGCWPGYSDDEIAHVSLPGWYTREFEDQL